MDWDGSSLLRSSNFVNSRPAESSPALGSFLLNYTFDQFPPHGMEVKHSMATSDPQHAAAVGMDKFGIGCQAERKKKLTSNQLESLERSFQEEIKLDPDRKMRLSRELGLQPRQIAVWFQNRRARWKAKQLERLYDALKQEFEVISREKLKLQEEVLRLKAMIRDQAATGSKKQVRGAGYTEVSGEETVESTSTDIRRHYTNKSARGSQQIIGDQSSYLLSALEEYNNSDSKVEEYLYWIWKYSCASGGFMALLGNS
ncbi:hypothetical protein CDL15_Pgr002057 [Punica granatum]|uniref:Homeobox-leucine zipper protein n=1 Tax=Punica granatum TaxID=22663 RepID=A0A218XDS4_PUNGR|nr:hypothetical protein CDL15_Pgr002057 [Punica granatum]